MLKRVFASLLISICVMAAHTAGAQDKITAEGRQQFRIMEDSLLVTVDSMYNGYLPEIRQNYCDKFIRQLIRTLKLPNSYYYTFDSLKTKINIIAPDDNSFRMFNWEMLPSQVTRRYYAAVQLPAEQLKLYPLIDCTDELGKNAQDSTLTNSRWYGAFYYRIITHEVDGQKIYTMFGLNAASPISNKKVLDPMEITANGIVFGLPIFDFSGGKITGNEGIKRFIIEYKKDANASMNWDNEKQVIYYDRLVSQMNDPNRKYSYVPSGEYDGFKWENDKWMSVHDLMPVQILKDGEAPGGSPGDDSGN